MTFEYDADLFRAAAGKSTGVQNKINSVLNTLNGAIGGRGNVWGSDKLGNSFYNGPGGNDGYKASRDNVTENGRTMAETMGKFAEGQIDSAVAIEKMERGNRDGMT
ncbi:hypothetical protein ACWEVD_02260 [Nocardia thailandica]|uniref:WXG100 family type VII secretion target n=1 Tax=Nocardia thailandica TaxID=257275 RepID=A0ABW6PJK4_9NOCA|nr:hypothetical protein [Nocardia thailandica]